MTTSQSWVGYLDRSYEQIKRSLLTRLGSVAPEISDHSESNPLIILLSMFAGVAEIIHLYIDNIGREAFLGTAQKYSSVVKLVKLIDYNIKARNPATVDLLFSLVDSTTQLPILADSAITIEKGTLIYPINSTVPFRTLSEAIIPVGYSSIYVEAAQYSDVTDEVIGITSSTGEANQRYQIDSEYVHNSMAIVIAAETWLLYNSFGLMGPNTRGCVIDIDEDGIGYLIFGDGVNGKIPGNNFQIYVSYQITEGLIGNLPPNTITDLQTSIITPAGSSISVNNPGYSSGGTDFEDMESIRNRAPRSIRTLDRAVTYQDYIDIAMQVPGVATAEVQYCCGKYVDVYIAPSSAGVATTALIRKVKNYLDCRAMVTTVVDVKPAGITRIYVKARVIGKPLYTEADILKELLAALDLEFGVNAMKINNRVSVTDIISVVEQLQRVDTIEIESVKVEPYARPIENTTSILNISYPTLPQTAVKAKYRLQYKTGTNTFEVYKNGSFITSLAPGDTYNDLGTISFTPNTGVYENNDSWEFTVFPSYPQIFPQTTILIDDYSAPVIEISPYINDSIPRTIFGDITIEERGSSTNCLPSCN